MLSFWYRMLTIAYKKYFKHISYHVSRSQIKRNNNDKLFIYLYKFSINVKCRIYIDVYIM